MSCNEKAEADRPTGNDDPILRWNARNRMILRETAADTFNTEQAARQGDLEFTEDVPLI